MRKKTILLIALLFVGVVILPGFTISSDGNEKRPVGCSKAGEELEEWLEGDNIAHVYFHEAQELFEGRNDGEAWGKMSYTFCGVPSRFVFNGHGLEREMPYALIAVLKIPESVTMPQPEPALLAEAMSNGGGNVHMKGSLPGDEVLPWDLYLVRAEMWEEVILISDEPVVWIPECDTDGVCEDGVLMAELSGAKEVPPVMTEASGHAIFYDNGTGNQLAYILQASRIGTVIAAHVHYGAQGTNGHPAATLYDGSDNSGHFLVAGMIMESGLMGDFAGSPVSALIEAMDNGMTYVNIQTEDWPSGEVRGQIVKIDISGLCHDIDGDDCDTTVDPMDPYYCRFEAIGFDNSCETDDDCIVGGCSSEVCASEPIATTCEELPYRPEGGCLCVGGICQWAECPE